MAALMWLAAGSAQAQCTGSRSLPLLPVPASAHFGTATTADFDAGYIVLSTSIAMTIEPPNQGQLWELCVQAAAPTLGGAPGALKPVSDLELSVGDGPWIAAGVAPVVLLSSRRTQDLAVRVRMRLSWADDTPGSYGTLLTFLATM